MIPTFQQRGKCGQTKPSDEAIAIVLTASLACNLRIFPKTISRFGVLGWPKTLRLSWVRIVSWRNPHFGKINNCLRLGVIQFMT